MNQTPRTFGKCLTGSLTRYGILYAAVAVWMVANQLVFSYVNPLLATP